MKPADRLQRLVDAPRGPRRRARVLRTVYPVPRPVYLRYMPTTLCTEEDLTKALPITPRKFHKMRRAHLIPYVKIDRYTRLYDLARVVEALEQLEVKTKKNPATK